MADLKSAFGGGGAGGFSAKVRELAKIDDYLKSMKGHLKEMAQYWSTIGSMQGGKSGANGSANSMSFMPQTAPPGQPSSAPPMGGGVPGGWGANAPWGSGPSGFKSNKAVNSMSLSAVTAMTQAVDPSDYIVNEIARRRFGFFSGAGGTFAGSSAMYKMMSRGTGISSMDAANAAMAGSSMGMMAGLSNYNTIINSVAGLSNLVPGAGLEASMGAVAALNQGSSVNRLRMIGINVRDQNGYMRNVEDIARDIWNMLNRSKQGSSRITQADLSYSLQPGMSVDMLLNQYFNGDPVLRDGIVSYLFQFASSTSTAGYQTEAGKRILNQTGANPGITQSIGRRNAQGYFLQDVNTGAGILGIQGANDQLAALSQAVGGLTGAAGALRDSAVLTTTYLQTLSGAGNGAGGTVLAPLIEKLSGMAKKPADILGDLFKPVSNLGPVGDFIGGLILAGILGQGTANAVQVENELGGGPITKSPFSKNDLGTTTQSRPTTTSTYDGLINVGVHPKGFVQQKDSQLSWASKVLKRVGAPVTQNNLVTMIKWMEYESSPANNYQTWNNPLNTTVKYGDYVSKNTSGVKEYATEEMGIQATANTLKQPNMKGILDSLKASNPFSVTAGAINNSPWGSKIDVANMNISIDGTKDPAEVLRLLKQFLADEATYNNATGGGGH